MAYAKGKLNNQKSLPGLEIESGEVIEEGFMVVWGFVRVYQHELGIGLLELNCEYLTSKGFQQARADPSYLCPHSLKCRDFLLNKIKCTKMIVKGLLVVWVFVREQEH